MKKLSLHTYLLSVFGILLLGIAFTSYQQLNKSFAQLSEQHVVEVAELHHKVIEQRSNDINDSISSIYYLLETNGNKSTNQEVTLENVSNEAKSIIATAFANIPSLRSFNLTKNNHSILRIVSNKHDSTLRSVPPIPIPEYDYEGNPHSQFSQYSIKGDQLFVQAPLQLSNNMKLILEISPKEFFYSTNHILFNKLDVGFYLVNKETGDTIYSYHVPKPVSPELIKQVKRNPDQELSLDTNLYTTFYFPFENSPFAIVSLIPDTVFLSEFKEITTELFIKLIVSFIVIMVALYFITKYIGTRVKQLSQVAHEIQQFNFNHKSYPKAFVQETDQLADSMQLMEQTIEKMLNLITVVSASRNLDELNMTLKTQLNSLFKFKFRLFYKESEKYLEVETGETHPLSEIDDHPESGTTKSGEKYHKVPLLTYNKQIIGCLLLTYDDSETPVDSELAFIERLSKLIAISLVKYQLLQQQKSLFIAFTQTIASAVDAKSPHTGGHCQRVPDLTMMMIDAAQKDVDDWKDFQLSNDELEEVYLAAWLHDCGKLTTQDHVIDKSTKLDMFTNRIHEIRTRFEVLKRDAEIELLRSNISSAEQNKIKEQLDSQLEQLDKEFELIANANLGNERFNPEQIEQLQAIAGKSYMRTLDKTIGLSWEESHRLSEKEQKTPQQETLLQDNSSHLIGWTHQPNQEERFTLISGENKYNFGELYNLSTQRGTLTNEERFLINDHIIQTIKMLETLPYPEHLKNVPTIAGGHHEKMIGGGYPRAIEAGELPVAARMLAVADIFEALTAKDRPYKTPKTLSESLTIMLYMANDGHIDKEVFRLFLTHEIYMQYANIHLNDQQIDEIDKAEMLSKIN